VDERRKRQRRQGESSREKEDRQRGRECPVLKKKKKQPQKTSKHQNNSNPNTVNTHGEREREREREREIAYLDHNHTFFTDGVFSLRREKHCIDHERYVCVEPGFGKTLCTVHVTEIFVNVSIVSLYG
jgi:hypothetical protein